MTLLCPKLKWPLLFSGHANPSWPWTWPFSGVRFHLVSWWRALYGPPALVDPDGQTSDCKVDGAHRQTGARCTMPGLSGTLTGDASWGSGCPPRPPPWRKRPVKDTEWRTRWGMGNTWNAPNGDNVLFFFFFLQCLSLKHSDWALIFWPKRLWDDWACVFVCWYRWRLWGWRVIKCASTE